MKHAILAAPITRHNLVIIRDRARAVGALCGLDKMDGTRFVTAVSEVARNAVQYAGEGTVTFHLDLGDSPDATQYVVAEVADQGPGIPDLPGVLSGRVNANRVVGRGLTSCRRLADRFAVRQPAAGGTVVVIEMARARGAHRLQQEQVDTLAAQLAERKPQSVQEEYEQQQRDMMQALQSLKDRQSELEMADVRKNQFVATLAHELRNPLGTLQMTLHILRRKPEFQQPELVKHLAVVERQAQQINQLVNDLMDASRVSQGKVELDKRPTDMNELVSQALEMTGAAMAAKKHQVDLMLSEEPLWVDADATRLKQVFSNVMHNAARYSAAQGRILVRVTRAQAQAVVEVNDQGFGIAPDLLPHVFGLFVQGANGKDGQPQGLGVGLSLAQRLVQEHGGTISAASEGLGRGSRFTVTLPLCAPGG